MTRPNVGTWCNECTSRGHRCQAQITVDSEPLCLPCADGEPCSVERVAAAAPARNPILDVFDVVIPISAKASPILKAILPSHSADTTPDLWDGLLGEKAHDVIAQAHEDAKAGKHLERSPQAKNSPTLAQLIEKHRKVAPKHPHVRAQIPQRRAGASSGPARQPEAKVPDMAPKRKFFRNALQPKEEKKVPIATTAISPETDSQMRADFIAGMSVNAVAKKHNVSWYVADSYRKRSGITPAAQIKVKMETPVSAEEKRDAINKAFPPEKSMSMEEVFQDIFPAKNSPPAPTPSVPTATVNGLEFVPPPIFPPEAKAKDQCPTCDRDGLCVHCWGKKASGQRDIVIDDKQPAGIDALLRGDQGGSRVCIKFEISEADAVRMFSRLSADHKGEALRNVLEASLLR